MRIPTDVSLLNTSSFTALAGWPIFGPPGHTFRHLAQICATNHYAQPNNTLKSVLFPHLMILVKPKGKTIKFFSCLLHNGCPQTEPGAPSLLSLFLFICLFVKVWSGYELKKIRSLVSLMFFVLFSFLNSESLFAEVIFLTLLCTGTFSVPLPFSSVQFNFIYLATNHSNSHLNALNIWR